MHNPTVVHHHAMPPSCGAPARVSSEVPPASMKGDTQEDSAVREPERCLACSVSTVLILRSIQLIQSVLVE